MNETEVPALDLDDPESWPTDAAGLAGLADGEPPAEAKAPEKAAVAPGADDAGAATAAADPKVVEDLNGRKEADPEGVLTRDGKHVIPYQVLESERKARQELAAQTETLTAEVKRLTDAAAAQGTTALAAGEGKEKPAAAVGDQALPADVKAKVDQLREDFGDDFADTWLDNWRTKAELAAVTNWIKTVESERATAESTTRKTEEDSIQEAIDGVPLLAEWQADKEHQEWYGAANEMHQMLMKSSAAYKAMPWAQRMEILPVKVEAVYGASPHSARKTGAADATKSAADAIKGAALRRPASMSDIPGGEAPAASEAERLEAMTAPQLQATIEGMAAKGGDKLESFLRGVSAS